jgi:hypothetical protein
MPSPFESLSGPGKPLKPEPPDAKEFAGLKRSGQTRLNDSLYEGGLNVDARIVLDLIAACQKVAAHVEALRALPA